MIKVATVILNWNGIDDTLECLESVAGTVAAGWEHHVVVVDNASTDGSADAVRRAHPRVTLIQNQENLGFAEGNNRGIAWAREHGMDYVILLNNDTVVQPDTFDRLLREHLRRPRAGALMPLIKFYDHDAVWYAGGRWLEPFGRMEPVTDPPSTQPYRTQLFTACCVLLPLPVIDEVGVLDSRLFIYYEDVDLSLRMERAGWETWVVPDAVMYHKVSRSNGGPVSPFAIYYLVRNNLLLIQARASGPLPRSVGYLYMMALSGKIGLNLLTGRIPDRRRAVAASVKQAWADFLRGRAGPRR